MKHQVGTTCGSSLLRNIFKENVLQGHISLSSFGFHFALWTLWWVSLKCADELEFRGGYSRISPWHWWGDPSISRCVRRALSGLKGQGPCLWVLPIPCSYCFLHHQSCQSNFAQSTVSEERVNAHGPKCASRFIACWTQWRSCFLGWVGETLAHIGACIAPSVWIVYCQSPG